MFAHEFVRNAYLAGTFIALACGTVGWFAVLRAQLFAGDALSHVAFVGAIAAAVLGLDERLGLFALTLAVAAAMSVLGPRAQNDDAVVGTVFAWILGVGILMIALLSMSSAGASGIAATNTLFGSIYSLSLGASGVAAVVALAAVVVVILLFRPLLLATLDAELAQVRGVPVRAVGAAFLGLLAVVTAESTQAVGALLLLGLLAAPAGAAQQLTVRPYRGMALAGAFAIGAMWGGLALSYAIASLPPSTAIIGIGALIYAACSLLARRGRARVRPNGGVSASGSSPSHASGGPG